MELLEIVGVIVCKFMLKEVLLYFENYVYIDVYGGVYVFFGGLLSIEEGLLIVLWLGIIVLSVDYVMLLYVLVFVVFCDLKVVYLVFLDSVDSCCIFVGGIFVGVGLVFVFV